MENRGDVNEARGGLTRETKSIMNRGVGRTEPTA